MDFLRLTIMTYKFFTLLIISAMFAGATTIFVAQEAAIAQNRGARFTFAPNYYKKQAPTYPRSSFRPQQPRHRVAHGSVPRSSGFLLGGTPALLKKKPHRQMTQSSTHVAMKHSSVNGKYKNSFGKPTGLTARKAGKLKAKAPSKSASKRVHSKIKSRKKRSRSVRAKRIKRRAVKPMVAKGYGNKFYSKGVHVPSKVGTNTSRSVKGRVLTH